MKEVVSDVNDDARIKEAFSLFDKDNNGHIDVEELGKNHVMRENHYNFPNSLSIDTIMKQLGQELNFSQIIVSYWGPHHTTMKEKGTKSFCHYVQYVRSWYFR